MEIPSKAHLDAIEKDQRQKRFLKSIIVCTESGYDQTSLKKVLQKKFELHYADNYKGILDKVIVQLLRDKKTQHLQAYGSSLEQASGR